MKEKTHIKIRSYKTLTVFFLLIPSIFFTSIFSIADDTIKHMNNTTLVEDFYARNYWNADYAAEYVSKIENNKKFYKINISTIPSDPTIKDETVIPGNEQLATWYKLYTIPNTVVEGEPVTDPKSSNELLKNMLREGVKKQKDYASFSLSKKGPNRYELGVKGVSEELKKYPNSRLSVILTEDWVNCDFTFPKMSNEHRSTLKGVAREYPLGLGQKINLKNGDDVKVLIDTHIPQERLNKYFMVAVVRDEKSKKVLSCAITSLADTDIAAYFNFNNWPQRTIDPKTNDSLPEYTMKTGLQEMKFSVKDAKDLKFLSFQINKGDWEAERYKIMGALKNNGIEYDRFEYDKETQLIKITFKNPLNGDYELFSFAVNFFKPDLKLSADFKVKNFEALNSKNESLYFDINDVKRRYPVQLVIDINPFDFNKDNRVTQDDVDLIFKYFGTKKGDINFDAIYDITKDGRVDISDIVLALREYDKQKALEEIIKSQKVG